ncbi:response regulator [Sorangium sp. So ce854]|uniref:response regulator n=1 Tax=Sorangium sp. So ce854 TaxID=3133322 RepID=UPI003F63B1EC
MTCILVIDDDAAIRGMFARALRSLGEVEEANGGAPALRRLAARKFDLVVLDLHMPLVDGFSVLESLSAKGALNRETPVFVVTADESQQARIRALRSHAIFLLSKPVHLATLVSLAESSLQKAASRATPAPPSPDRAQPDRPKRA